MDAAHTRIKELEDEAILWRGHERPKFHARIKELEAENCTTAKLYHDAMEQLNCRDTDVEERDAKIKKLEQRWAEHDCVTALRPIQTPPRVSRPRKKVAAKKKR